MVEIKKEGLEKGALLLVDKPLRWSSAEVVTYVKKALKLKKIGHAGTLDPLATGLLILVTGKATKQITRIHEFQKEYEVVAFLGATTPSYDAEFEPEVIHSTDHLTLEVILSTLHHFRGEISQKPPPYSAVKIGGKRAYERARKGEKVDPPPKMVTIYALDLMEWNPPHHLRLRVVCGKGTYIRSLVHDLGQMLGVGAYVYALRRTRIGPFSVDEALHPYALVQAIKQGNDKGVIYLEEF